MFGGGGGLFGSRPNTAGQTSSTGTSSLFGQQPATSTTSNLFGGSSSSATPQSGLGGGGGIFSGVGGVSSLFGSSATTSNPPGGSSGLLFGSPTQQQTSSLFGQQPQTQQTSSLFGQQQPTATQSSSLFGGGGGGGGGGLFGSTTAPLFGSTTTSTTPLFGGGSTQQGTAGSSLFGLSSSTQQQQQPSNLFGTQPSSIFGTQQQPITGATAGSQNVTQFEAPRMVTTGTPPKEILEGMLCNIAFSPQIGLKKTAKMIRYEDYMMGRRPGGTGGSTAFGGGTTTSSSTGGLFGSGPSTPTRSLFGTATGGATGGGTPGGSSLFGTTSATGGGLFGQQQQQPSGGLFGQPTPSTGGGLFGQQQQPTTSGGGLFGQQQQSGGLFGTTTSPSSGGGLFGSKPASSLFGQQQQQPSSLFGQQQQQPATTTSSLGGGGLFGSSPSTTSSIFGKPAGATTTTGGLFGQPATTTTTTGGGGLFGSSPSTGLFGSTTSPTATTSGGGGGLFGTTTTTGGGLFGTSATSPPATTTSSLFGTTSGGGGGGLFGTSTGGTATAAPSTGLLSSSIFGQPAATTTTPAGGGGGGLFGTTTGGGLFGSSSGTTGTTTSGGLFGSTTAGAPSSLFGAKPATSQTSTIGGFGSTAPALAPFGSTTTTTRPSLFSDPGAAAGGGAGGGFQAVQPQPGLGSGLFTAAAAGGGGGGMGSSGFPPVTATPTLSSRADPYGLNEFVLSSGRTPASFPLMTAEYFATTSSAMMPSRVGLGGSMSIARTPIESFALMDQSRPFWRPLPKVKMHQKSARRFGTGRGGLMLGSLITNAEGATHHDRGALLLQLTGGPFAGSGSFDQQVVADALTTGKRAPSAPPTITGAAAPGGTPRHDHTREAAGSSTHRRVAAILEGGDEITPSPFGEPTGASFARVERGRLQADSKFEDGGGGGLYGRKSYELDESSSVSDFEDAGEGGGGAVVTDLLEDVDVSSLLRRNTPSIGIDRKGQLRLSLRSEEPSAETTRPAGLSSSLSSRSATGVDHRAAITPTIIKESQERTIGGATTDSSSMGGGGPSLSTSRRLTSRFKSAETIKAVLPRLTRADYVCRPSLEAMAEFTIDQLSKVQDFTIIRMGFGEICWPGLTDVRGLDLDAIVEIDSRSVEVYGDLWAQSLMSKNPELNPDDIKEPPIGEGLNKKAIISLQNCAPPPDLGDLPLEEAFNTHVENLKLYTSKMGATFMSLDPTTWTWRFRVEHF